MTWLAEQTDQPVLVLDPEGNVLASEASRREIRKALGAFDGDGQGWSLLACRDGEDLAGWLATPGGGLDEEASVLGAAWRRARAELSREKRHHDKLLRNTQVPMRLVQPSAPRGPVRQASLDGQD